MRLTVKLATPRELNQVNVLLFLALFVVPVGARHSYGADQATYVHFTDILNVFRRGRASRCTGRDPAQSERRT
jgi:hypothetical protein